MLRPQPVGFPIECGHFSELEESKVTGTSKLLQDTFRRLVLFEFLHHLLYGLPRRHASLNQVPQPLFVEFQ